jgi:hypothetical protein
MIDAIKKKLAMSKIRQDASHVVREKQVFNLDDAKTIGIAFEFTGPEDFELLKKYVIYLREHRKKVKCIGYYTGKTEPAVQYSKVDYDFINEKSFTWYGKPSSHIVSNFIEEPYDVYIDVNLRDNIVIRYIAYVSAAKFKIGHYKEDGESPFDMQISVPKEQGLKAYLREVDTYLQMINKPSANAQ